MPIAPHYAMGLDVDLNKAIEIAVQEKGELLQEKSGLTAAEGSAPSLGVDFRIAEAVDGVQ